MERDPLSLGHCLTIRIDCLGVKWLADLLTRRLLLVVAHAATEPRRVTSSLRPMGLTLSKVSTGSRRNSGAGAPVT